LSSRNQRLSPAERAKAAVLYRGLQAAAVLAPRSIERAREAGLAELSKEPGVGLDYFELADADTLRPLTEWGSRDRIVALVAARVGQVRLIDNLEVRR
jgi:pantoate--beta-alanine ligase